ncbi:hypothetical protein FQA39_LY08062 [Lamprigera yunnana]|nr:hypothetical protein FQA39_LY08062 [Lamprigera yunnana]
MGDKKIENTTSNSDMNKIEMMFQIINDDMNKMNNKLDTITKEINQLKEENTALKDELINQEGKIEQRESEIRKKIIIKGIQEKENEDERTRITTNGSLTDEKIELLFNKTEKSKEKFLFKKNFPIEECVFNSLRDNLNKIIINGGT